jgi:hypothetical protein
MKLAYNVTIDQLDHAERFRSSTCPLVIACQHSIPIYTYIHIVTILAKTTWGTFKNARIVPGLFGGCQASSEPNEIAPAAWNIEKIQQNESP